MIRIVGIPLKRYPGHQIKLEVEPMAKRNPLEVLTVEELLLHLENAVINYHNKSSRLNLDRMVKLEKEMLSRLAGNYYAFEELQELDELQLNG